MLAIVGTLPSSAGRKTSALRTTPSSISIATSQSICMSSRTSLFQAVFSTVNLQFDHASHRAFAVISELRSTAGSHRSGVDVRPPVSENARGVPVVPDVVHDANALGVDFRDQVGGLCHRLDQRLTRLVADGLYPEQSADLAGGGARPPVPIDENLPLLRLGERVVGAGNGDELRRTERLEPHDRGDQPLDPLLRVRRTVKERRWQNTWRR